MSTINSHVAIDTRSCLCESHSVIQTRPNTGYYFWKGALDRTLALILLIPGLPLIGILVALIRLTSNGPGVYSQTRVGRGGRIFTMYKLRSMRIDAEAATGPVWAGVSSDPRVTSLGWWLRKLHLDELPQLFNVLCGDMSLVGPRPERPEFVRVLGEQVPDYLGRLAVKPGVTGLAQVNLPPDTDLDSVRRKIVLDRQYIESAGLLIDIRLIFCTILRCFGLRGGKAVSLLGLKRHVHLEGAISPLGGLEGTPLATPDAFVQQPQIEGTHGPAPHNPTSQSALRKRRQHPGGSQILKAR
jgi:lipopolysaccharide/colanic/teichoic acid biosynthesis glycosyltransferase